MPTFFSELRRRNVFRVAAAYAVVAWILIEAGSVLMPTFGASEWAFQVYTIIVIGGFIVSVVFAWIFELTPEGVRLERDVDRAASTTAHTGRKLDFIIIALLVVALAISVTLNVTGMRTPEMAANRQSIAVLPFSSLSSDPENDLFADGIHDDLITKLANISAFKVISRTSVMEYRNTTKNLRQIGGELGVGTVVEGAVQRSGDRVRINAQLIDAQTDQHIWAQTYDRRLSAQNIFDIQSEISQAIAHALKASLTDQDLDSLAATPTENLAAYNLYTKGRANLYLRTLERTRLAKEQFEQAIRLDPDYAEAYAGLADALLLLYINHNVLELKEALDPARQALDRALELDPKLADAYASLGLLHTTRWTHTRDESANLEAALAYQKAIELSPNHARAIMWYASLRASQQRFDEAIALYQRSLGLDPLARVPYGNLPGLYAQLGRNREALEYWLEGLELHPDWPTLYQNIATHMQGLGRLDEAIAWYRKERELSTDPLGGVNIIGPYIELGFTEEAQAVMLNLPITPEHPFYRFGRGLMDFFQGDYATSVAAFEAAIAGRDNVHPFLFDVLSDAALLAGDGDKAYRYAAERFPELGDPERLVVDRFNVAEAIKLAYILQRRGEHRSADRLLAAARTVIASAPRLGLAGHGIRDVQVLALQGEVDDALDTLQRAISEGYRASLGYDGWVLEQDPYLRTIREHPRFATMLAELEGFKADMRENVRQAELAESWDELRSRAAREPVM